MFEVGAGTKTWFGWQGGVHSHCLFFLSHHFLVWNRVVWEWSKNKTVTTHTMYEYCLYPLRGVPHGTNSHVLSGCWYQNMIRLTRWCEFPLFISTRFHTTHLDGVIKIMTVWSKFLRCDQMLIERYFGVNKNYDGVMIKITTLWELMVWSKFLRCDQMLMVWWNDISVWTKHLDGVPGVIKIMTVWSLRIDGVIKFFAVWSNVNGVMKRYFGVNNRPFFGNCVITPYGVITSHVFSWWDCFHDFSFSLRFLEVSHVEGLVTHNLSSLPGFVFFVISEPLQD
jgi:hypothetical protein